MALKFLNISCKKATYLLSKKEANQLSWLEKIQLHGHLTICQLCRRFDEQSRIITQNAPNLSQFVDVHLSEASKEKMKKEIREE